MSATVSTRLRLPSDQATSSNCGGGATGELSIDSFLREGVRGGEGSRTFWSSCITVSVGVCVTLQPDLLVRRMVARSARGDTRPAGREVSCACGDSA